MRADDRMRKRLLPMAAPCVPCLRDTFNSRMISLIDLPRTKCSRLIRPIVSTTSIPRHPLASQAGQPAHHSQNGVRSQGWTASGRGFDRPLGVMFLELRWAQISERGVESSGVVDLVDEARRIGGHVFEGLVFHQADGFDLQRLHKALG